MPVTCEASDLINFQIGAFLNFSDLLSVQIGSSSGVDEYNLSGDEAINRALKGFAYQRARDRLEAWHHFPIYVPCLFQNCRVDHVDANLTWKLVRYALYEGVDGAAGGGVSNCHRNRFDIENARNQRKRTAIVDVVQAHIYQIDLADHLALDSCVPLLIGHFAEVSVFAVANCINDSIERPNLFE